MPHFYWPDGETGVELFDNTHPMWGHLRGWPLTKAGTPKKQINDKVKVELGLFPGVTDILKMVGGPKIDGLIYWSANHGIDSGLSSSTKSEAQRKYKKASQEAAFRGTRMHHWIQVYLETAKEGDHCEPYTEMEVHELNACRNVFLWIEKNSPGGIIENKDASMEKRFIITPLERNYYHGFGGTIDYQASHNDRVMLVDFKTVSHTKNRSEDPAECAQLSAYSYQLSTKFKSLCDVRLINLYISQETGELYKVKEWSTDEKIKGNELFLMALRMWYGMLNW